MRYRVCSAIIPFIMRITYLGPRGTFSDEAARLYVRKTRKKAELFPEKTIYDAIRQVIIGRAAQCIVPIENSVEGTITVTADQLAAGQNELYIVAELAVPISNNLLVLPGVRAQDVAGVFSHPQPLGQCQEFLRREFPQATVYPTDSTADGVRRIKNDNLKSHAAIGSRLLAKLEHMKILKANINDRPDNVTRFVVLSRKAEVPAATSRASASAKTSIVFSCKKDKPGSLYEILGFLAKEKINMTKIESRPNKTMLGEYVFFVDFEGTAADRNIQAVLHHIEKASSFYKLLGSYRRL